MVQMHPALLYSQPLYLKLKIILVGRYSAQKNISYNNYYVTAFLDLIQRVILEQQMRKNIPQISLIKKYTNLNICS